MEFFETDVQEFLIYFLIAAQDFQFPTVFSVGFKF